MSPATEETDYEAGSLVQQSYRSEPGASLPALSYREVWRGGGGWRGQMDREANYWDALLSNYRAWKEGGIIPAPYADMFAGYSRGARMILDIRLEHCAHAVGNPSAMRLMWIQGVLERLDEQRWHVTPATLVGIFALLFAPLWAGAPVFLVAVAVTLYWLRKVRAYRRRLEEQKEELALADVAAARAEPFNAGTPTEWEPTAPTPKLQSKTS